MKGSAEGRVSSVGRDIRWGVAAAGAVLLAATACARQGAPPGGPADRIPPFVIATEPDTFATVESFDGAVKVEFNERISERAEGGMNRAVEISPRSGEISVRHRRRGLDIEMDGGFREGLVYRITILPVVADMFSNRLADPFEFFFSTGGAFNANALAGVLTDRITGAPVQGARVDAWQAGADSVIYTGLTDRDGIFAIRSLPEGEYTVRAYMDVNRNLEPDFIEIQAELPGQNIAAADTSIVFMALLAPDSTPSRLAGVTPLDSVTLELGFDDFMDPDSSVAGVGLILVRDSVEVASGAPATVPAVSRILHPAEYQDYTAALADSVAAAQAAADTAATPLEADPSAPALPTTPVPEQAPPRPVLPGQLLYALLDGPLEPGALYTAVVSDVTNIAGVQGGGGETQFQALDPIPDSLTALPDSLAPEDSLAVPDSLGVPPDSGAAVPDTTRSSGVLLPRGVGSRGSGRGTRFPGFPLRRKRD